MSNLVIVESPTKAKTITKFLGKEYDVTSSMGHIRDLPRSDLGVAIEKDFEPTYQVSPDKKKVVTELKKKAKAADTVYFATDEDREGEAISWHLQELLKVPAEKTKRIVFHEITKDAIVHALETPRNIDTQLVDAQEARRILDRLFGYKISPILWRKVAPKLSAGRVQSVAVRLIVDRERERIAFVPAGYGSIKATFVTDSNENFEADLKEVDEKKIAIGKDFDPKKGTLLRPENVMVLDEKNTATLIKDFKTYDWRISDVEKKPFTSRPKPPFTTSTLQQAAGGKLGFTSRQTMQTAQKLYEKGHITYMRTDSVTLSKQALSATRSEIESSFGKDYLPEKPNFYKNKVKNAQEAHEAIRPAGSTFKHPDTLATKLNKDEARLYRLIWQRTMASQMNPAKMEQTTIHIHDADKNARFAASGKTILFPGFLKAYGDGSQTEDTILPNVTADEGVTAKKFTSDTHQTKPIARFTEASLVKELEARGIGRPSTYASIINTILARQYVRKVGTALVPTFMAFGVIRLLEEHFKTFVDYNFTADMEEELDNIARGEADRMAYLKEFYFGDAKDFAGLASLLDQDIDARDIATTVLGKNKKGEYVVLRIGRYGPFVEIDENLRASVPDDVAPDELNLEKALELLEHAKKADEPLGNDPATGLPVFLKTGRYGPYLMLGEQEPKEKTTKKKAATKTTKKEKKATKEKAAKKPKKKKPKMKPLLKGMKPEDVTFDIAVKILEHPKKVGVSPINGEDIIADLGRFGPYIKAGTETRSIPKDMDILTLTEEQAIELLKREKKARFGRAKKVLKDLGEDKKSKKKIQILDGRYGPYVSDGKLNASLPKDTDPKTMKLEDALELLAKKKKK
jgi:DNA topoisomerase-1